MYVKNVGIRNVDNLKEGDKLICIKRASAGVELGQIYEFDHYADLGKNLGKYIVLKSGMGVYSAYTPSRFKRFPELKNNIRML